MDFDFSTLITDRSPSDLELLRDLLSTPMSDWTAEQLAAFNQAVSKGAYNYTDLNRVTACMDYLNERLTALGYVTGYVPIIVNEQNTEDPHTWSESNIPTYPQMQRYITNGKALRETLALPENTAAMPEDMVGLTQEEANAIEGVLGIINDYLEAMQRIFLRSGMTWAISGGPNYYFAN